MVELIVNNSDLISFIKRCNCYGTIKLSQTDKVNADFFRDYYLEATEDRIEVKSVDSNARKMYIWHKLSNVIVNEPGKFAITDSGILFDILKMFPSNRKIAFTYKDGVLSIMTADDGPFKGMELKQSFTLDPNAIKTYESSVLKFLSYHSFLDNDMPKISDGKTTQLYDTVVDFVKEEFGTIIKQSIELTKDDKLNIQMDKDGTIRIKSGQPSSKIKSSDIFHKRAKNPIEFNTYFKRLQPIWTHLFGNIRIYFRKLEKGSVKIWIQSKEGNIELNFASGDVS